MLYTPINLTVGTIPPTNETFVQTTRDIPDTLQWATKKYAIKTNKYEC